jgi:hypothetical protein
MNQPVALVMDRNFGEKAGVLSERMHTWLIDSETNRAAAEPIWARLKHELPADPRDSGLTLFRSRPDLGPREAVDEILDTIVEHHPRVTVIQVYGVRDRHLVERPLAWFGFHFLKDEGDHLAFGLQDPA